MAVHCEISRFHRLLNILNLFNKVNPLKTYFYLFEMIITRKCWWEGYLLECSTENVYICKLNLNVYIFAIYMYIIIFIKVRRELKFDLFLHS